MSSAYCGLNRPLFGQGKDARVGVKGFIQGLTDY